jgi:hypothetical protein
VSDKKVSEEETTRTSERNRNNDQSRDEAKRRGRQDERKLSIRKITDQTPLPPKRFESKKEKEEEIKEVTKEDVYFENRAIEEGFHAPPQQANKQTYKEKGENRRDSKEGVLKSMTVPTFDSAPAVSLKDALAKAMREHEEGKIITSRDKTTDDEQPTHKEVPEETLRKLLED